MPKKKIEPETQVKPSRDMKRIFLPLGIGLIIIVLVLAAAGLIEVAYREKVFPGVLVADVAVGNISKDEAREKIEQKIKTVDKIQLVWGVNKWEIAKSDIDLKYDTEEMVNHAMMVGRNADLGRNWKTRIDLLNNPSQQTAIYSYDEGKLDAWLAQIGQEVNIPAIEPEVSWNPNSKQIEVSAGQNGRLVDNRLVLQRLRMGMAKFQTNTVALPVTELKPQLSEEQIQNTKQRASVLVGKSLTLNESEDQKSWTIESSDLLRWIDPMSKDGWKEAEIRTWVDELAKTIDRQPENASFHVSQPGRVTEFKPAKNGLLVQQDSLFNKIISGLNSLQAGQSIEPIAVVLQSTPPSVGNGDANTLGINELLSKGESWFSGSITNRIFNLQKAADLLNGVLVPPGETFSFNKTVGEISQATGFKSAFIIKDGKTILGDGGGVCQVSSTLFRAVLAAGLPIPQRTAHAYRVSYYEQNYQPGFDATIFQPSPDFTFVNDTKAHILIQTEFDEAAKKLTFYLYGTSDGRKAEVSKARVWDVIAAPPDLYIDDPTLAVGQVKQTEHKANGAKVAFDWKVTRGDEVLQEKTFYSVYKPWQAVYLRGTKTN